MPLDWEIFHSLIATKLRSGISVLDVGCGKASVSPFPWNEYPTKLLVGLDPDPSARENPFVDRIVLLRNESDQRDWPLDGETFDLVLARYVLEHVKSPAEFLRNVRKALKPGGEFLFLTPNLLHPAIVMSRGMPHRLKERILRTTNRCLDMSDVFPTYYRMNTTNTIRRQAVQAGLTVKKLMVKQPQAIGYLDFSVPTFLLSCAYYYGVEGLGLASVFGSCIIGVLQTSNDYL
jgi:SAM-dependent methyltransferase